MEYFRVLRDEIIEAQKLRIQVGLAKIVFLGTLLGFFLKDARGDTAILICPFVALMFDCMVYGLSFNIRDVGNYIRDHVEREMLFDPATMDVALWQTHRADRNKHGFRDWGRIMFRVGSYGLSILVAVVSFFQVIHPRTAGATPSVPNWWLVFLILILALGWGMLIWLEFLKKPSR
jgi:hypothetical protein